MFGIKILRGRFWRQTGYRSILILMVFTSPGCGKSNVTSNKKSPAAKAVQKPMLAEKWPVDNRRHDVFVGSSQCAECHSDISRSYAASHPMGRSIRKTDELSDALHASLPVELHIGSRTYAVSREGDHLVQSESMFDQTGEIYKQSCDIDFAVGSGIRGYSFVTQREGSLFQAPLTWYSQGNKWDLSPGYRPEDHARFERKMSDGCLVCHSGNVNRAEAALNRFQTPPFHESSIGCERCHGPGEQHVTHHADAQPLATADRIVNPRKLERDRRDSVCYQCHLHGRGRVLRANREEYDFRPGDLLSDIWVTFVDQSPQGGQRSEAVSQVEQMVSSQCYANNSEFGCISCHDPHQTPATTERIAFYRNKCMACHKADKKPCTEPLAKRQAISSEDSCIQCHMPPAGASDVPHTAQTDHRILRSYDHTEVAGHSDLDVFGSKTQRIPQHEIQRAFGLMTGLKARSPSASAAAMDLLALTINSKTDVADGPVLTAAAWLVIQLGDFDAAQKIAQQAIMANAKDESALEALAIACEAKGDFAAAQQHIKDVLGLTPWNTSTQSREGRLFEKMNQPEKAISAYKKTLKINPLQDEVRQRLIKLLTAKGQTRAATIEQDVLNRITAEQNRVRSQNPGSNAAKEN